MRYAVQFFVDNPGSSFADVEAMFQDRDALAVREDVLRAIEHGLLRANVEQVRMLEGDGQEIGFIFPTPVAEGWLARGQARWRRP